MVDSLPGTESINLLEVRIYCSKQLLDQRPKAFISQSGMSTAAAVVAAPVRKLCDEYPSISLSTGCSRNFIVLESVCRVKNVPFENLNRGMHGL